MCISLIAEKRLKSSTVLHPLFVKCAEVRQHKTIVYAIDKNAFDIRKVK